MCNVSFVPESEFGTSLCKKIVQSLEMKKMKKKTHAIAHGIQDANILLTSCVSRALVFREWMVLCTVFTMYILHFIVDIRIFNTHKHNGRSYCCWSWIYEKILLITKKEKTMEKTLANFILQFSSKRREHHTILRSNRSNHKSYVLGLNAINIWCKLHADLLWTISTWFFHMKNLIIRSWLKKYLLILKIHSVFWEICIIIYTYIMYSF